MTRDEARRVAGEWQAIEGVYTPEPGTAPDMSQVRERERRYSGVMVAAMNLPEVEAWIVSHDEGAPYLLGWTGRRLYRMVSLAQPA
jgi:hypothetical protein